VTTTNVDKFESFEKAYFRSSGSTKASSEYIAQNDFPNVVTTTNVDKFTAEGILDEDIRSLMNASLMRTQAPL